MNKRWALLVLLAGLTVTPSRAVVLRYKFKTGQKLMYRDQLALAFVSDGGPQGDKAKWQYRSDSLLRQTVKKVDSEAVTVDYETVENHTELIHGSGETNKSQNTGHPERVKMTSRGKVVERKQLDPKDKEPGIGYTTKLDEFAIVQQVFDGLLLPEEDVEPGATWTDTVSVDLTPGDKDVRTPVEVKTEATFKRVVIVRGEECAELVTDFTVPLKTPKDKEAKELNISLEGSIIGHLTSYFAIERGQSVVELATLGALGKMTLQPPGAPKVKLGGRMKINIKTVLEE